MTRLISKHLEGAVGLLVYSLGSLPRLQCKKNRNGDTTPYAKLGLAAQVRNPLRNDGVCPMENARAMIIGCGFNVRTRCRCRREHRRCPSTPCIEDTDGLRDLKVRLRLTMARIGWLGELINALLVASLSRGVTKGCAMDTIEKVGAGPDRGSARDVSAGLMCDLKIFDYAFKNIQRLGKKWRKRWRDFLAARGVEA